MIHQFISIVTHQLYKNIVSLAFLWLFMDMILTLKVYLFIYLQAVAQKRNNTSNIKLSSSSVDNYTKIIHRFFNEFIWRRKNLTTASLCPAPILAMIDAHLLASLKMWTRTKESIQVKSYLNLSLLTLSTYKSDKLDGKSTVNST